MTTIELPLYTARLRLEPVTAELSAIANEGVDALARQLDADIPTDWMRSGLPLVKQRQQSFRTWRPMRAVAIHRGDNRVIGDVRFERMAGPDPVYEVGYAIIPAYRLHGYAVEAAGRVVDWLFETGEAELIWAGCDRRNKASVKTLRKLGFWLDGSRGDAFWWRLTPELRDDLLAAGRRA